MRTFTLPNTHLHPELDYNAFCQCTDEYSGNFYDFIPQEGSRLVVSFGDLPSTGDVRSINIPCLQALVRGLTAGRRGDLAGLAREINGTLYLLGAQDLCAPWFYAHIDAVRHELRYVNAGHESPLLIRKGAGVQRLERTGAALALSARGTHRQETLSIDSGDILAIFSEALPETIVLDVVLEYPYAGAAELARRVLDESRRCAGKTRQVEDCSFAAVRIVGACRHPLPETCDVESLVMCAA